MQEQDHNLSVGAVNDDNSQTTGAGMPSKLAGKFSDRESLLDSTAELVKQVAGRELTYSEVKTLQNKADSELEGEYLTLEREFHNRKKQDSPKDDDDTEILQAFEKYASKLGFVKKSELEAERYEKEQLNNYISQNPDAQARLDLIKTLAQTDGFKNKSYKDVDDFIKKSVGHQADNSNNRNVKLSSTPRQNKGLADLSDDEFAKLINPNNRDGSTLKK